MWDLYRLACINNRFDIKIDSNVIRQDLFCQNPHESFNYAISREIDIVIPIFTS